MREEKSPILKIKLFPPLLSADYNNKIERRIELQLQSKEWINRNSIEFKLDKYIIKRSEKFPKTETYTI